TRFSRDWSSDVCSSDLDIVKQIVQLKSGAFLPKEAAEQYELYGMRADKAKIFEWHYASLPAKTRVVSDVAVAAKVEDAIETAERSEERRVGRDGRGGGR